MFHSALAPDLRREVAGQRRAADLFRLMLRAGIAGSWPEIPMVGRSNDASRLRRELGAHVHVDVQTEGAIQFGWGRVPFDVLARYFIEFDILPASQEYLDLGTPMIASGGGGSSGSMAQCKHLLGSRPLTSPQVGVAIIDRGDPGAAPETFGGRVRHAVASGVQFSRHAEDVLAVLLERLDARGILGISDLTCALVLAPPSAIGPDWFRQANAVEVFNALDDLKKVLLGNSLPIAFNMCLGTHVGPHNGNSPLEERVRHLAPAGRDRFFVVAAGNFGMSGVADWRRVAPGAPESFLVRTGPSQGHTVLVEFWWHDPGGQSLLRFSVNANTRDPRAHVKGALRSSAVNIDSVSGPVFSSAFGQNSTEFRSLYHARCHNDMSCVTLALSTTDPAGLPVTDLECDVEATPQTFVDAWIVVADDPLCTFVEGTQMGSIVVPASQEGVIGVAGTSAQGKPWRRSSRGPGGFDVMSQEWIAAPLVAAEVTHGLSTDEGTSFASPRACGDVAEALANAATKPVCKDAIDMAIRLVGRKQPSWNARTGFGILP